MEQGDRGVAAKDKIHSEVKSALIRDGWAITDDPFTLTYRGDHLFADLAAERVIVAQRQHEKIIVEVKRFL